jgi:iron complex outermembrane recepter protein
MGIMPVFAQNSPTPAPATEALEKFEVTAQKQSYGSLYATGATKTDTPIKDLPQSVRVLSADLLQEANITRFADALELTSGISRQNNFGGLWDSYSVRGFTGDPNFGSDFLVNGFNSGRGYNGLRDSVNTDSIEVLKGPAAALYGRGEPGGIINITTKKPLFQQRRMVEVSYGSFNTYRVAADLTGPISETVAYRLNLAKEDGDTFRDFGISKRHVISPSLLWAISPTTTLSYEAEIYQQKSRFDRGVVAVKGELGLIPNSRFLGEPNDGSITIDSAGHQLFLQHQFSDSWSLQSGLSYRDSSLNGFSTEASGLLADGRTLRRQRRYRDFSATDVSARAEIIGSVAIGSTVQNILIGVDGYKFDDRRIQLRRNPSAAAPYAIDIFNPVYGQTPLVVGPSVDTLEAQKSNSIYAQDQINFSQEWKALLGVRYDNYRQTVTNYRFALLNNQKLTATSPRVGLVYQPISSVSLYASAAKSFRPNSGIGISGEGFPAETGRAYEFGVKLESFGGRLSSTVAMYKIDKKNVLTVNPLNTDFVLAAGEVASKGLEVDVAGQITRSLRLSFAYAYTNAKVTKDNVLAVGGTLPGVPKQSANLLAVKDIKTSAGVFSLGGGVNYVGKRNGDVAITSTFNLPAYTTVKLITAFTPMKTLRLSLDVDNLLNKTYWASSYQQVWVNPGAERTVTAKIQYKF